MNETCPCCGAPMRGSDHCWFCGCEEYESYCDAQYVSTEAAPLPWCPVGCWQFRQWDYCPHTDGTAIELAADSERVTDKGN